MTAPETSNGEELYEEVAAGRGPSQRRQVAFIALLGASLAVVTIVGLTLIGGFSGQLDTTQQTTQAIQDERARSIRRSCEDINERHNKTIRRLDRLIAQQPPAERAESMEGRAQTVFLLNAIVPLRNCDKVVRRSVRVDE